MTTVSSCLDDVSMTASVVWPDSVIDADRRNRFGPRSGIDRVTQRQHARQSNRDNRKEFCVHRTANIHGEPPLMLRSKGAVLQPTLNLTTDNVISARPPRVRAANYLENEDCPTPQVLAANAG